MIGSLQHPRNCYITTANIINQCTAVAVQQTIVDNHCNTAIIYLIQLAVVPRRRGYTKDTKIPPQTAHAQNRWASSTTPPHSSQPASGLLRSGPYASNADERKNTRVPNPQLPVNTGVSIGVGATDETQTAAAYHGPQPTKRLYSNARQKAAECTAASKPHAVLSTANRHWGTSGYS